jgi:carboxyl-terminal processing protease
MLMPRYPFAVVVTLSALLISGCAVLDPYNMIGRSKPATPLADSPIPIPDTTWRARAIDVVWNTVNERYYDPKLNGVDWQDVRKRYEPRIMAAATDDEYWELLDKMTGELKDSHTRVHSPKDVERQRKNEAHTLGFGLVDMEGALVVTSVHPDSDAWWAGVRQGMVLKSIEGESAIDVYRRYLKDARDSSTEWARSRGAVRKILVGDVGTGMALVFQRTDGSEIAATIKRRAFKTPPEFVHRVLPSGFGYIRFSGFVGGLQSGVLNAIDEMKNTPGLIVDLRNNGGGSGEMAQALIAKFLAEKKKVGRVLTRTGKPISLMMVDLIKLEPELEGNKATAYTRPLVVLANEGSASAAEIMTGSLKDLGRATIIGRRTCGCLLGYLGYADLPGGGQLAYSEIGFESYKGERVEHNGVTPDREVVPTREDYLLNRDRTLETAVAFLQAQTTSPSPSH